MNYIMLYAMSKELKVGVTAMLAQRIVNLGGLHIHKLFCLVDKSNSSIYRITKLAIQHILTKKKKLQGLL